MCLCVIVLKARTKEKQQKKNEQKNEFNRLGKLAEKATTRMCIYNSIYFEGKKCIENKEAKKNLIRIWEIISLGDYGGFFRVLLMPTD